MRRSKDTSDGPTAAYATPSTTLIDVALTAIDRRSTGCVGLATRIGATSWWIRLSVPSGATSYTFGNSTNCPVGSNVGLQPGRLDNPCDQTHFWSLHPGGANFLFADGSVHFLYYSADRVLPALATRAGGEVVGDY